MRLARPIESLIRLVAATEGRVHQFQDAGARLPDILPPLLQELAVLDRQLGLRAPDEQVEETGAQGLVELVEAIDEMGGGGVMAPAIDLDCAISLGSINLPLGIGNVSLAIKTRKVAAALFVLCSYFPESHRFKQPLAIK